ncbi:MAG: MaoC family dehydratase [Alphaproteobacteria bacterium]|nr:MaoC family dehydratase [Alphaproteobacteria bacterium]
MSAIDLSQLQGLDFDEIKLGQTAIFGKTVTEADILTFAAVSGDTNPVHLNEEFVRPTMFKTRIAHGMLSASFISTVIGTKLPGPGCIYVSQSLRFKAPVKIGDTVIARAEVTELNPEKRRLKLKTTCHCGETVVIDGEAEVFIPKRG